MHTHLLQYLWSWRCQSSLLTGDKGKRVASVYTSSIGRMLRSATASEVEEAAVFGGQWERYDAARGRREQVPALVQHVQRKSSKMLSMPIPYSKKQWRLLYRAVSPPYLMAG